MYLLVLANCPQQKLLLMQRPVNDARLFMLDNKMAYVSVLLNAIFGFVSGIVFKVISVTTHACIAIQ